LINHVGGLFNGNCFRFAVVKIDVVKVTVVTTDKMISGTTENYQFGSGCNF
jgi:hypothetical protein